MITGGMPGGSIEGDEGIFHAVEREVWEETNLRVAAKRIAYVEELIDEGNAICKFWVCRHLENVHLRISKNYTLLHGHETLAFASIEK